MSDIDMKDKAGRSLEPGDYIVYGHALGRCAGLRYGMVINVYEPKDDGYGWWPGKAEGKKKVHVRVRGVDDDWQQKSFKLLSKDSTLQFGDRILRISSAQMPKEVLELLNDWNKKESVK
jgi:hypothetical protein